MPPEGHKGFNTGAIEVIVTKNFYDIFRESTFENPGGSNPFPTPIEPISMESAS